MSTRPALAGIREPVSSDLISEPARAAAVRRNYQLVVHCGLLDPRTMSTGSSQWGLVSENLTGGASRISSP